MFEGRTLIGRYRLLSRLGSGGMGSVWRAHDLRLNADVAVKLIDARFMTSAEALARFRREAQAAAAIRSTYVVQILDHGVDEGVPFIAMELLSGESLGQRLARVGRLDPESTARLLAQVARALSLAHERGIVHRDMKPDNIFLVQEGDEDIGKVLDFGVARAPELNESGMGVATQTGAVLGTPFYMSPEQANGKPLDSLTDIWSFGVIACECLTGRRPFVAESLSALFHAICLAPQEAPSSLGVVPAGFDAWYARATARDKAQRFSTIREAADQLRAVCVSPDASLLSSQSGRPSSAPTLAGSSAMSGTTARTVTSVQFDSNASHSHAPTRRRSSATLVLGGLAALLVLGVGLSLAARSLLGGNHPAASVSGSPAASLSEFGASKPPIDSKPSQAAPLAGEANTAPDNTARDNTASEKSVAPVRSAPGVSVAPSAAVATSLPSAKARAAARTAAPIATPVHPSTPNKPSNTTSVRVPKRDDNAAGI